MVRPAASRCNSDSDRGDVGRIFRCGPAWMRLAPGLKTRPSYTRHSSIQPHIQPREIGTAVDAERQRLPPIPESELRKWKRPDGIPEIRIHVEDVERSDRQRQPVP